jgi:hypothetical protein
MERDARRLTWEGEELVDPDEAYVRGQGEQAGSGLIGGWSQANLGGFFEAPPSKEIHDELRRLARRGLVGGLNGGAGSP